MSKQEKHLVGSTPEVMPAVAVQQPARPSDTVVSLPEYSVNIRSETVDGKETKHDEAVFRNLEFNDKTLRMAFVKKVYAIVLVQLVVTAGFIMMCRTPIILEGIGENTWVIYIAIALYFGVYIAILCCEAPRRKVPHNYIFLGLFTLAASFLIGIATTCVSEDSDVLIAFGATMALVAGLTLFAFQTKIDFTMMSGSLYCVFLCVLIFGTIAAITRNASMNTVYSALVVIVFSVYLVYDTQMMIGGKHKYAISPEEYIFAALCLYMDIINIFLRILRLMRS